MEKPGWAVIKVHFNGDEEITRDPALVDAECYSFSVFATRGEARKWRNSKFLEKNLKIIRCFTVWQKGQNG